MESIEGVMGSILAGNIGYLIGTLIISETYQVTIGNMVGSTLSGVAPQLISSWVTFGALLGVLDVLLVAGAIASILDASGR